MQYKTEQYTGTSTLISSSTTTWEQRPANPGENIWWSGGVGHPNAPRVDTRPQKVENTVHQGGPITSKREFLYDQYNNRTDTYEYDWDASTPIRRTHLTYETSTTYMDPAVHIRGLVTKSWVCGSGTGPCVEGSAVSKTEYVYDGESLTWVGNGTTGHINSPYGSTSYTTRGNLTKVRRWRDLPTGKWIESRVKYNTLGNPIEAIDPLNTSTTVSYTDSFENPPSGITARAFPTSVTRAGQTASTQYDYWLGKPTRFTDLNGVQSTYDYNDQFDRLTDVNEADNHPAQRRDNELRYFDTAFPIRTETRRDQYVYADEGLKTAVFHDKLGRQIASRSDACSMTTQSYDGLGRVKYRANPIINCSNFPPAPAAPWTETQYDGLGRVTAVIRPGGATSTTVYSGDKVTVTDAAGKKRELTYDALGQLTKVVEDPTGSLNYVTEYSYNTIGKLTQVLQKGTGGAGTQQTRTFSYDSLGRLLSADNPEDTGLISYAYDDNGNLTSKTDARGVVTTLAYDTIGRISVKSYSDGTPTERFCYDGKVLSGASCVTPGTAIPFSAGRLTMSDSVYNQRQVQAFDPLGRVLSDSQTTVVQDSPVTSQTYNFSYTYNLDGSLASQTYPSGRVVDFTYDASGRPYAVGEAGGGASYLNSVAYAAHGGIDHMQLGNQLTEQTCYNDLLQPIARRLGNATSVGCAVQTASDLLHLGFGYGASTQNNGNMVQQTIWAPDNGSGQAWQVTQDYTYDQVNRLATAAEKLSGATQWTRSYSYDHFGNRWISGATGHTLHMATPTSQSAIQASTNRLTGAGIVYDHYCPANGSAIGRNS